MKYFRQIAAVLFAVSLAGCAGTGSTDTSQAPAEESPAETAAAELSQDSAEELIRETVTVEMEVENYGTIVLELDGETAPITVTNFVNLAESGFYDGLTFHRIMDGFMIQGGDPQGNGYGGSGKTIKGEFKDNGVDNPISHQPGTISMARSSMGYDTASSQFFICVADDSFLDGSYAAFGHVTEGYELCEKIAKDARPVDKNGTIPAEEQPKIKSVKVKR